MKKNLTQATILEQTQMFLASYPVEIVDCETKSENIHDVLVWATSDDRVSMETIVRNEKTRIPVTIFK